MPIDPARTTNVIGTPCLEVDAAQLLAMVEERSRQPGTWSVDFTNVHITALRRTDADFRRTTDDVDWFVPDSQVLRWAVNLLGGDMAERVYGPDFLAHAVAHCRPGTSHYFLGGSQDTLDRLLVRLRELRPDLRVAGSHHGYFESPSGDDDVVDEIERLDPDFIWVGLGTPRQQQWIAANRRRLRRGALLAVGFAFDVNAGTKDDAPAWMQRRGLTWIYRLASEPRRLWKRYLVYNTVFVVLVAAQRLGVRRYDDSKSSVRARR